MGLPASNRSEIDLWACFLVSIDDEALMHRYRALLSVEEKERERRFRFPKDKKRFVVTRALVRTVLSRYVPVAPEGWSFAANAYGRPVIAGLPLGDAPPVDFNVTHTDDLIVMAVAASRCSVGVDAESLSTRRAPMEIASRFFAPAESAVLDSMLAAEQTSLFFQLWTLKESYLKACGRGLSIPLEKVAFALSSSRIDVVFDAALGEDESTWSFWQIQMSPDHLAAVCCRCLPSERLSLNIRSVVPLQSDEALQCSILRSSCS
jgi:4'-phosphopantetheinyl transferase